MEILFLMNDDNDAFRYRDLIVGEIIPLGYPASSQTQSFHIFSAP